MADNNGLVPTNNNDGAQELAALKGNLEAASKNMVVFSVALNCLFSEQKVSSTAGTKDFIEVRNNTRRNATVYQREVLPKAESIVQKISAFMDYYQHLEYEDWKDCLEDQIQEAKEGEADCQILIQMHKDIIKELNKDVGKARMSQDTLKLEADRLEKEARNHRILGGLSIATSVAVIGLSLGFAPFTAGASLLAAGEAVGGILTGAGMLGADIYLCNLRVTAADANAKKVVNNIDLVSRTIGSLQHFVDGLTGLSSFFSATSSKLEKLKGHAEAGKRAHFMIMKSSAEKIEKECEGFLAVAQFIKTQMDSIPKDPSDDNYVDRWLKEQLEKFERKNSFWGGFQRLQWEKKKNKSIAKN